MLKTWVPGRNCFKFQLPTPNGCQINYLWTANVKLLPLDLWTWGLFLARDQLRTIKGTALVGLGHLASELDHMISTPSSIEWSWSHGCWYAPNREYCRYREGLEVWNSESWSFGQWWLPDSFGVILAVHFTYFTVRFSPDFSPIHGHAPGASSYYLDPLLEYGWNIV